MEEQTPRLCPDTIKSLEIICVGTELLMGHTVNTNAAYLAEQLACTGVPSYYQSVVGDNPERLLEVIRMSFSRSGGAILTGGLGPTADDITVETIARMLDTGVVIHPESQERIERHFQAHHIPMTPSNLKQARVPVGARILPNDRGTAPGGILEVCGKVLIWLPGPPTEMREMFEKSVKNYLKSRAPLHIESTYIRLFGIGESAAEDRIKDLMIHQTNPTIAPYCSTGECMFRISYSSTPGHTDSSAREPVDHLIKAVSDRLGDYIYEIGKRTLPEVVSDLLRERKKTISFAESCTAGLLTSMIGEYPGASDILSGSVIAYSNTSKTDLLGIPSQLIATRGAVSEEVAMEMAIRCRQKFSSDLAVSITGIAGPDKGTAGGPVGLVYLGFSQQDKAFVRCLRLSGDRSRIRYITALNALDLIRKELIHEG
jgi:nicotinamide-nucleotide amidase